MKDLLTLGVMADKEIERRDARIAALERELEALISTVELLGIVRHKIATDCAEPRMLVNERAEAAEQERDRLRNALEWKTSSRINFASDSWGAVAGNTHFEFQWGDRTIMMDIPNDGKCVINVIGDIQQAACNRIVITNPKAIASAEKGEAR